MAFNSATWPTCAKRNFKYIGGPIVFLLPLLASLASCKPHIGRRQIYLTGYINGFDSIYYLPESVSQISGMVYSAADSSIFCVDDGIGILYKLSLHQPNRLQQRPFSVRTDHEALVRTGKTFYALQSNGVIETIRFGASEKPEINAYRPQYPTRKNEFETLFYDKGRRQFLVACKACGSDADSATTIWGLDSASLHRQAHPVFRIGRRQIEEVLDHRYRLGRFRPSDAAVHPLTGDFYFVSAVNHLLLVTDRYGLVKEATPLDRYLFKQPEALAFMPDGTLLIANEAAETGPATILRYRYQNPSNAAL